MKFQCFSTDPGSWKITAHQLKYAADRLFNCYREAIQRHIDAGNSLENWHEFLPQLQGHEIIDYKDSELLPVYYLLAGLAAENLLKSIIVAELPAPKTPENVMKVIKSHDLPGLWKKSKLSLDSEEKEFLQKLETYVVWQARYPAPLDKEKAQDWEHGDEGVDGRSVQDRFDRLFHKILAHLDKRLN